MHCDDEFDAAMAASQAVEAHFQAMPMQDGLRWITVEWYAEWRRLELARDEAMAAFRRCAEPGQSS
jgi:hypothetical protein